MTRIKLISVMAMLLMLSSCSEAPDGIIEVNVEGWEVPAIGLVSEIDSFECKQMREISKKIVRNKKSITGNQQPDSGYYYIDYKDSSTSFRSYFRPNLLISENESTFIFCSGAGISYEKSTCGISSIKKKYCYDFFVEKKNKKIETFDTAISAIDLAVHRKRIHK